MAGYDKLDVHFTFILFCLCGMFSSCNSVNLFNLKMDMTNSSGEPDLGSSIAAAYNQACKELDLPVDPSVLVTSQL